MSGLINSLYDYVFFHDLEGNLLELNSSARIATDYTGKAIKKMNIRNITADPYKPQVDEYLARILKNGKDSGIMRAVTRSGELLYLEYNCSLIRDPSGRPSGARGIARNITETIEARRELKKKEEKYRSILENIEEAYYEVDLKGNYEFCNEALPRLLGYSGRQELIGKNYREIIPEDAQDIVFKTFNYVYRTGSPVKALNWKIRNRDGSTAYHEASVSLRSNEQGRPVGFQGMIKDITERVEAEKRQNELEAQLHQAQKMESIGTLAGGIAHDFNNILFPIMGYTDLAMQELPSDSQACEHLSNVLSSAHRAKALVRQILAFSRHDSEGSREPEYIQPVIKETLKLLERTVPANIKISSSIHEDTGRVMIEPSKMHQVFMNLCTNAYQAMSRNRSGSLEVDLRQVEINAENTHGRLSLPPGEYIQITVSDNGCGIPPDAMDKIFDPYFTTKSKEEGTGLGLSVSYGMVKNAGGIITVSSTPGQGSRFRVYLPAAEEQKPQTPEASGDTAELPGGSEHILLVEDEKPVLELEKRELEELGYTVTSVSDSPEALEVFKSRPMQYDLLLTDLSMPKMSGLELIRKARELRPEMPAVLCTGFSDNMIPGKGDAGKEEQVLLKPASRNELAEAIRNMLDKQAPGG